MDDRHLQVVSRGKGADATEDDEVIVVPDVSAEENPWTADRQRAEHPSVRGRGRPELRPELRPTVGRDDRIRAYLRLVEGP